MNLTFVEQPPFTKAIIALGDDNAYRLFQNEISEAPERWPVVQKSGGLRKARMRLPGRGKSGGARVLYLYFPRHRTVVFLMLYEKGEIENVPAATMKGLRDEVQRIKNEIEDRATAD